MGELPDVDQGPAHREDSTIYRGAGFLAVLPPPSHVSECPTPLWFRMEGAHPLAGEGCTLWSVSSTGDTHED
jgi:hypothetical protein